MASAVGPLRLSQEAHQAQAPELVGWTDLTEGIAASVDYGGLADAFAGGAFGTETMGTVTERLLKG